MSGSGPEVDVNALVAEARRLLGADGASPSPRMGAPDAENPHRESDIVEKLKALLVKDPHSISVKHDYLVLREVIGGALGPRPPEADPPSEPEELLLAVVLAGRLSLDGLLLAAQALFHVLPDRHVQILLVSMHGMSCGSQQRTLGDVSCPVATPVATTADRRTQDAVFALYYALMVTSLVAAGPDTQRAVRGAVRDHGGTFILRECTLTSHRTKAAFKMLQKYLHAMKAWRLIPSNLDNIFAVVWTGWEVPLPGVRELNEELLVELLDLAEAIKGFTKEEIEESFAPFEDWERLKPECLRLLLSPQTRWVSVLDNVSWRCKDKYVLLRVLGLRLGPGGQQVLVDRLPLLTDGLLWGMQHSHLASAATATYRSLVMTRVPFEAWTAVCLPRITARVTGQCDRWVQNVLNYWIVPTVRAYPDAYNALQEALVPHGDEGTPAYLYLLMVGRKDGYWDFADKEEDEKSQSREEALLWIPLTEGSRHRDSWVRGIAFLVVCSSARACRRVGARELALVRRFLETNVRADDPRLRHTLLQGLDCLLMRVRNSLPALLSRPTGDSKDNVDLAALADFLGGVHQSLLDGLSPGTNYQRRATSLAVYRLLLLYLPPSHEAAGVAQGPGQGLKKGASRSAMPRSEVLDRSFQLSSAASRRVLLNCIMDGADDVRNKAADILISLPRRVAVVEKGFPTWDHVVELCNSPFFYMAESGAVLGAVLSSWGDEDFVQPADFISECERQLAALHTNVMDAASGGSPLHGMLGLLRRLLPRRGTGPSGRPSRRRPGRWAGCEGRLVTLLERNVALCLKLLASKSSSDSAFAPSFAEMGEALDELVSRSASGEQPPSDSVNLSPKHQLLLNCIWLNLKASCSLASDLVEVEWDWNWSSKEIGFDFTERCARLPVTVLLGCRHKGAIEAAGTSLQQIVKILTEQTDPTLRRLPHELLVQFLDLLLEGSTAHKTSVTRRSAGMAILVHRIVLGDKQPDKPLLHECMSCLFKVLEHNKYRLGSLRVHEAVCEKSKQDEEKNISIDHDLPVTQALHFLCTLVADSSLRIPTSFYLSQAAVYCFWYLNSLVWGIRNASLQLFGSLVPKIAGQGKSTGESDDDEGDSYVGCTTCYELEVRFEVLSQLLLDTLKRVPADGSSLDDHAALMPALTLLARLSEPEITPAVGSKLYRPFKDAFLQLLSSPIAAVRIQAAKSFTRFTPLVASAQACEELLKILPQQVNENGRNGVLAALLMIKDRLNVLGALTTIAQEEEEKICRLLHVHLKLITSPLSFSSQALLLSILDVPTNIDMRKTVVDILDRITVLTGKYEVGIPHWIMACLNKYMKKCTYEDLPYILDISLRLSGSSDVPRTVLHFIHKGLDDKVNMTVAQHFLDICLNHVDQRQKLFNYETFHLLDLILKIIDIAVGKNVALACDTCRIAELADYFLSSSYATRCEAISLPVIAGLCFFIYSRLQVGNTENSLEKSFDRVLHCLLDFSCPDKCNQTFRWAAATALPFASKIFMCQVGLNVCSENNMFQKDIENGKMILRTAIQLLQDEDIEIREQASRLVSKSVNSLECLSIVFSENFLLKFLQTEQNLLLFLWELLSSSRPNIFLEDADENPFDHGSNNIFAEDIWIVEQAMKLFKKVSEATNCSLASLMSCDAFCKSFTGIQSDFTGLITLTQENRNRVLEESKANATYLLQKRIDYRLEILRSIAMNEEKMELTEYFNGPLLLAINKNHNESFAFNFTFYR